MNLIFHPSEEAFQGAIDDGHLSTDPHDDHHASHYMYMGTVDAAPGEVTGMGFRHCDLFKHKLTRQYLRVPCTWSDMSFSSSP